MLKIEKEDKEEQKETRSRTSAARGMWKNIQKAKIVFLLSDFY